MGSAQGRERGEQTPEPEHGRRALLGSLQDPGGRVPLLVTRKQPRRPLAAHSAGPSCQGRGLVPAVTFPGGPWTMPRAQQATPGDDGRGWKTLSYSFGSRHKLLLF